MVWMYAMSTWALVQNIQVHIAEGTTSNPVAWISVMLVVLAALMLIEAIRVIAGGTPAQQPPAEPAVASA